MTKKEYIRKIGNEEDLDPNESIRSFSAASAVCWAPGRTIGNIAVSSEEVFGHFEGKSGNDAVLPCHIIPCGKFRNGAKRWYCKTHQMHWGTLADIEALPESGEVRCSNHTMPMSYVVDPTIVDFNDFEEIGIWCSLPPALSSRDILKAPPKIHLSKRTSGLDNNKDFDAIICSYNQDVGLFASTEITQIQVTPPAAFEFVRSLEEEYKTECVSCKKCGYPHLDLGSFARHPHSKHFCGNCGNDSVISSGKIISTPLKPLHDQFHRANGYCSPDRRLNLDEYAEGHHYDVWASTPAILWSSNRPQLKGIHVRVYEENNGECIVDDIFSEVIFQGRALDRKELWGMMTSNTIY